MALSSTLTAGEILNRVAAEVGIAPVVDPLASVDPLFVQLKWLLVTAGEELMQAYPWELLVRKHEFTTVNPAPDGYAMPTDFGYILNGTQWNETNRLPMGGPLSAQQWSYLKGYGLAGGPLYTSYRISSGTFNLIPEPAPAGETLSFEYISSNWVWNGNTVTPAYSKDVLLTSDTPLFDRTLITRAVKVKYLEAAGFDSTKAQADYNQIFSFLTGNDKGAPVLNAGGRRGSGYLLGARNIPFTNFGL